MLERIKHWFGSFSTSRAEHEAAWSAVREPGPDGFSAHQRDCERELQAALELRGLSLQNRRVELVRPTLKDPKEALVYAEVPQLGAEIWVSASQTDIDTPGKSLRLEEWDCRTPAEHVRIVRDFVESLPLRVTRAAQQGVEPDVE